MSGAWEEGVLAETMAWMMTAGFYIKGRGRWGAAGYLLRMMDVANEIIVKIEALFFFTVD